MVDKTRSMSIQKSSLHTTSTDDVFINERLMEVKGLEERTNDVFVCGNVKNCSEHIIFFGGDVQDFPERMMNHRDNKRYVEWNLEATSQKINKKFPQSLVLTIKPSNMYLMTFSVYSNFVEFFELAKPLHCQDYGALTHLYELYHAVLKIISDKHGVELQKNVPIHIIGFSKGCVVLNQFVFEFPSIDKNEKVRQFVHCFHSMYWLDGGHCGGPENTYVTQDEELKTLASMSCQIFIHVTPYQIKDPLRTWIGKQEAKFYKKLKKFNACVHRVIHFDSEPASIENHFRVLEEFKV